MELPGALLCLNSKKQKKSLQKYFLYFRKWNFLAPRLKNFLCFRKWNALDPICSFFPELELSILLSFLYFRKEISGLEKRTTEKKPLSKSFLYFLETPVLIFWETKFSTLKNKKFQKKIFASSKNKNNPVLKSFLHFVKWNFLARRMKRFLYFRRGLAKLENQKFHSFCLLKKNFSNLSAK